MVAEPDLWLATAARSNPNNSNYNFTCNLVNSSHSFLDKAYRALNFASPTSLSLTRTSGFCICSVSLFHRARLTLRLASAVPNSLLLGLSRRELSLEQLQLEVVRPRWTNSVNRAFAIASSLSLMDFPNYKEWPKKVKNMELPNRKSECVLNLAGSLQGTAWKLAEEGWW